MKQGEGREPVQCPDCDGAGELWGSDCWGFGQYNPICQTCNGEGVIMPEQQPARKGGE